MFKQLLQLKEDEKNKLRYAEKHKSTISVPTTAKKQKNILGDLDALMGLTLQLERR